MEKEKTLKFNPEEMMKTADSEFLEWMKNGKYAELLATMPTLGRYSLRESTAHSHAEPERNERQSNARLELSEASYR